jgi:hypothetical protein
MACKVCGSGKQKEFTSEVNIHPLRGLKYLNDPCVFVFPQLLVCLDCGFTELVLEEKERNTLREHYGNEELVAEGERSTPGSDTFRADDSRVN